MIRLTILSFLCVGISSCDPGATYNHFIDNRSSHKIFMKIIQWNTVQDSVVIDAHSKTPISSSNTMGGSIQKDNCTNTERLFEVGVIDNSLLVVTKDVNKESNSD